MTDRELVDFLQWALPRLGLRWAGFRKVRGTVRKRIARRLAELGLGDLPAYRAHLEHHPVEWRRLAAFCRIPISRFFRDRAVYGVLATDLLPALAKEAGEAGRATVRVLSAGCASGEEPYSVALAWTLGADRTAPGVGLDVLGVDADDAMLERARTGCYGPGSLKELPPDLVERAFERRDGAFCLADDLRRAVRFASCDLTAGLPPGPFDLVLCRNVAFTYFDDAGQRACLDDIRTALRDGGWLIIGTREHPPNGAGGFEHPHPSLPVWRKDPPSARRAARPAAGRPLVIDGAQGEGGGQIVRTAVSISALTGRPIRIGNVRANRRVPGLAAQHVTAIRAAATLCDAVVAGDAIGSREITFVPRHSVAAGDYLFDVAVAREGGSAGSATLVLQTVLLPLALAAGRSTVLVEGGTHLDWSPPFDFIRSTWLPALWRLGIEADVSLDAWGWYPAGGGAITCRIRGRAAAVGLASLDLLQPGPLEGVTGRAVAARLSPRIAERMADLATEVLGDQGIACHIDAETVESASPGAGIFLTAHYRDVRCGFSAVGRRGVPAEKVAAEAVAALLAHRASGAALDRHLADQILLPLACAAGTSRFSVERVTAHIETNASVIGQFGMAEIAVAPGEGETGVVTVTPTRARE
jgi:RNA 3'-terminal phosphate cyclase (ATP)